MDGSGNSARTSAKHDGRHGAKSIAARMAFVSACAMVLGGCGYRELKAPCGPNEGGTPGLSYAALFYASEVQHATGSPLHQLGVGGSPVSDPCGPPRPINGTQSTAGDPP
jgi:hypothetical protein